MRGRHFPRYTAVVAAIAVALSATLLSSGLASAASANQAPPDKANAPATDLKDYPKKPAPSIDPARWGSARTAEVYSERPRGTAWSRRPFTRARQA